MKLSKKLQLQMRAVRGTKVRFDGARRCFVDETTGRKRRGLTKTLARIVPVPLALGDVSVASDPPQKRTGRFVGATVSACLTCKAAMVDAVRRQSNAGQVVAAQRNSDRAHGAVVDEQLAIYAAHGREGLFAKCAAVDPCVGALIEQLDADGLVVFASQTPIFCERLACATAIDLLATDRAKRESLILIEVKATRAMTTESVREYEAARSMMTRGVLKGLPLSYYTRHQTQLLCMQQMLELQCGIRVDKARVMRVAPGIVHTYPLAPDIAKRGAELVSAMERNARRRLLRKKRQRSLK